MAYVVEKAGLHYAVIYEGVEPITRKGTATVAPLRRSARDHSHGP